MRTIALRTSFLLAFLAASATFFNSCAPTFDAAASTKITDLQKLLPSVISHASHDFAGHESDVKKAMAAVDSALDYAKNRKRNKAVAEMYGVLKNDLLQKFFDRWKSEKKLGDTYIKEFSKQLSENLARIANAENAKKKKK